MSVADYLLWALQRYILKGEKRYYLALQKHYHLVWDVYDDGGKGKIYDVEDPFDVTKASPFLYPK